MEQYNLSFDQMPQAIARLLQKVEQLESAGAGAVLPQNDWAPMTIKQAAEFLGREHKSMYNLVKKKSIPFHKQGTLYFFKPELIDWIKNGETPEVVSRKKDSDFGKRPR